MRPSRRWSTNNRVIPSWCSWDRTPCSPKTTSARTDSMSLISTRLLWPRSSTTSNKTYWSSNTSTWYRMATKRGTCSTFSVISQANGNHDRRSGTNSKWRYSGTSRVPSSEKPGSQFKMFIHQLNIDGDPTGWKTNAQQSAGLYQASQSGAQGLPHQGGPQNNQTSPPYYVNLFNFNFFLWSCDQYLSIPQDNITVNPTKFHLRNMSTKGTRSNLMMMCHWQMSPMTVF